MRPLVYDAIAGRSGCEPESGNTFYGLKAFNELCVAQHDAESVIFGQPDTVSYSDGPLYKGVDEGAYMLNRWAAWVATAGVRVGKVWPVTLPGDNLGDASALYPQTKPTHLTHAWSSEALLAIAIQKDEDTIELKQYIEDDGEIATYTWEGQSPVLVNSAAVVKGDPSEGGLVCYYLKEDKPRIIYARFERDDYATERVVMPELRVPLVRLIRASSFQTKMQLFALDDQGRDVTLTTPIHPGRFDDAADLAVGLVGGAIYNLAVNRGEIASEKSTLDIAAPFGEVLSPLVEPAVPPPAEAASLSVALVGGEVT